jgi:cold shock CspA family protein/ribosome-associated translation inhibitor RaiA
METLVEIDFQGMPPQEHIREAVASHIAALEKRFGRIAVCRVTVKGPSAHHRTGGAYQIKIHLALLDGREVDIDLTANDDERFADPDFAVNDAFKRARRRLQQQVRRMQGQVKARETPPLGTVLRVDEAGGFGFLGTPDGREIYFHRNSVLNDAFASLKVGTLVAFAEEEGEKGRQANTVRVAGKHGMR